MNAIKNIKEAVKYLSDQELSIELYHIACNTNSSKSFTREYMMAVVQEASERLDPANYVSHQDELIPIKDFDFVEVLVDCGDELQEIPHNLCRFHPNGCNHPEKASPCIVNPSVDCHCCFEGRCFCNSE